MDMAKLNNMAVAGLILGIVSIVFAFIPHWICYLLGLVAGIVGIVISVKGRKSKDKKSMATAGLVLSIIGTVLLGIMFVCAICVLAGVGVAAANSGIDWSELSNEISSAASGFIKF